MLNDTQIDTLAANLIDQIDLHACLGAFQWNDEDLLPAWKSRQDLASAGFDDGAGQFADRVHRWGFRGQAVAASVREQPGFGPGMQALCRTWSAHGQPWNRPDAMESLIALLGIAGLGIARVTKFVCFLDQERYAIYDSRVSYALKDLTLDGVKRVFPFVGGRQVKNARYVLPDAATSNPRRIAIAYVGFLRLLQRVAERLNDRGGITSAQLREVVGNQWTPALLEMALFMAGQYRIKTADIRRLDTRRLA